MSYSALGQMGGMFGWYSLWGNIGQSWRPPLPNFIGWMYTDHGTAQFVARRASGAIGGYRAHGAGRMMFRPAWQEIYTMKNFAPGGGPCTDQTGCIGERVGHVSWYWPGTEQASQAVVDMVLGAEGLSAGVSSQDWIRFAMVGDALGRRVQ